MLLACWQGHEAAQATIADAGGVQALVRLGDTDDARLQVVAQRALEAL